MSPQSWSRGQKSPEKETFQASSFTTSHALATTEQTHVAGNVLKSLAERVVGRHGSGDGSIGGESRRRW